MFERPRELALPVRERPHHRDWPERAVAFGNEPSHRQLFARGPKSPLRERRCQTLSGSAVCADRGIGGGCGDGSTGGVPIVWRRAHEGARFCDACGSPLAASADAAEYKQVAVQFADAVRSMDIAVALDLGRLRSEQDPGYTLLSARPGEKG